MNVHINLSALREIPFTAGLNIWRIAKADLTLGGRLNPFVTTGTRYLETQTTLYEALETYRCLTNPTTPAAAGFFSPPIGAAVTAPASAPVDADLTNICTRGGKLTTLFAE